MYGKTTKSDKGAPDSAHKRLRALRVGKTGEPCHPLYLPYSCERIPFGVEVRP